MIVSRRSRKCICYSLTQSVEAIPNTDPLNIVFCVLCSVPLYTSTLWPLFLILGKHFAHYLLLLAVLPFLLLIVIYILFSIKFAFRLVLISMKYIINRVISYSWCLLFNVIFCILQGQFYFLIFDTYTYYLYQY